MAAAENGYKHCRRNSAQNGTEIREISLPIVKVKSISSSSDWAEASFDSSSSSSSSSSCKAHQASYILFSKGVLKPCFLSLDDSVDKVIIAMSILS